MSDLIERLRVTRLLSQRNQYALQAEAADQLEAHQAEIARLRRGLENACMCLGRIRSDKDASYAAEGHDKARAALDQKP